VLDHWRAEFQQHADDEYLTLGGREVKLTRKGLLRVDSLLPAFFEPEHRGVRYT
jgi:oxygen-independent coproporphyrinogen-3 oxidase